ncbi:MAG: DUF3524 domain-containing protein [Thermodesulfobacteriota bacterium]
MRLLLVEPYYGGSHRHFLDDLIRHLPFDFSLLTLPPRAWKWRMRFAAPWCAAKLKELAEIPDAILCSTFIDVASLRGLGPDWLARTPIHIYFHENQFAYPVRQHDPRDVHFGLTNYLSAVAADSLAFNSAYNLTTFLAGCKMVEKRGAVDMKLSLRAEIAAKAQVLPVPLDFAQLDSLAAAEDDGPSGKSPVIVWNHRWEHDKNPEEFFSALFRLADQGGDFKLIVLGQSFQGSPDIFAQAKERLADKIIHFGFAPDRATYLALLKKGTIVVSTARHEFYGLAVLEAVRAGCHPLLPHRLSYPELFPAKYLYEGELLPALAALLARGEGGLGRDERLRLTDHLSWQRLAPAYGRWLAAGAGRRPAC